MILEIGLYPSISNEAPGVGAYCARPPCRTQTIPRPAWMSVALILLATAGLSACARVHVTIETTIGADGTVSRKVDFLRARGPSLEETYKLPSGPGWTVEKERVSKEGLTPEERSALAPRRIELPTLIPTSKGKPEPRSAQDYFRYSARRTYLSGQALEPDYVRPHPGVDGRAASNEVRIERTPGLLGTTVRYRETFTEASEPEALAAFLEETFRMELGRQIEAVRRAYPGATSWDKFKAGQMEALEARLEGMLSAWRSISDETSRRAAENAFERCSEWMESIPKRISTASGLRLEQVEALLEDPEQEQREAELSDRLDRYVGTHIGEGDFSFSLIVHMPGTLISSNAEELRGRDTAICRFTDEYILMRPYTCEAESWVPTGF